MATNTTVTSTALPDWYVEAAKKAYEKAYAATGQPYAKYDAARIAPFTPEQQQAFGMVQDNIGNWQPTTNAAAGAATEATNSKWTDPGVASAYMNPYTENVVNDIGKASARNLTENLLPQVNRTFVGGGTFGGSRSGDFTARAVRDANESALTEQNKALQAGYADAGKLYGADETRGLEGAKVLSGIGGDIQSRAGTDAAAVENIGIQQQGLAQKSADLAYQDFTDERDYDLNMAKDYTNIVGQPSADGSGSKTTTAPAPDKTKDIVGGVVTGIGELGKIFDKKEGGPIRRARGGPMERLRIRYGIGG